MVVPLVILESLKQFENGIQMVKYAKFWPRFSAQQKFSICLSWPFGDVNGTFHKGRLRPMKIIDIHIKIHNCSKIQLWSPNKNIFWLEVTTTWGTVLKGHSIRIVEN